MDRDQRELVQRLFAAATIILEDAHQIAIAGQSHKRAPKGYAACEDRLRNSALDLRAITDSVLAVLRQNQEPARRNTRKRRRAK